MTINNKRLRPFAMMLIIALVMSLVTPVAFAGEGGAENKSKYEIKTGEFASRLRNHYGPVEFEIHFNNYDKKDNKKDNKIFNSTIAKAFMEKARIKVNDGKEYSFKDIEFENDKSWDGNTNYHIFKTQNKEFIKTFVNSNPINVEITDPNGNIVKASIKNEMSDKEKEDFLNSSNEGEAPEPEPETSENPGEDTSNLTEDLKYEISTNPLMTRLKNDLYTDEVSPKFQMAFVEKLDDGTVKFNVNDATKMDKDGYIIVNGGKKWSFKDANLVRPNYGMGPSNSSYETKNLEFIKEFAGSDNISVKVILDNKVVAKGSIPNNLSADEKAKFPNTGGETETPKEPENPGQEDNTEATAFYKVKTALMHSSTGENYPYTEKSMAGAVMKDDGEIIETKNGKKLIVHFKVAEVMGARAYATGFELSSKLTPKLKENEKGDVNTEFIVKGDDSAIMIVDIPEAKETVYEGYIYSNIMSNTAALKFWDVENDGDSSKALEELISKVESDTNGKKYYDREAFDTALQKAKKAKKAESGENYIALLKAYTELREKLSNPFGNGDLFFVPVKGSSAFANPPGTSKYIVKPWARVEKKNGKTVLTVDFDTYSDWSGKHAVSAVKVYGEDGETEVNIDFEPYSDGTGKLSFEMPFYPESGTYKTVLTDLTGREWPTDLILDYAHMHKGMRPELIQEAIDKYDSYDKDWVGHEKGKISEDKEKFYTEKSFKHFLAIIKKCENDLLVEKRKDLTQDIIDKDVELIKNARENLIYRAQVGKGNTINKGTNGIGNPGNIYSDEGPHMEYAPWAGSKVLFGGHRYKVLNSGLKHDFDSNEDIETGNLLIMADDFTLERPWMNTKVETLPKWKKSDLRDYLNKDYYNNFNALEKSLIKETILNTQDATTTLTSASIDRNSESIETTDKIFIADINDMKSKEYGYVSQESRKTDEYYFIRNLGKGYYESEYKLMAIKPKGTIEALNQKSTEPTKVYPLMNLDKSKIMMTVDAKTGIPKELKKAEATESNLWKLVVSSKDMKNPKLTKDNKVVDDNLCLAIIKGSDFKSGEIEKIGMVKKGSDLTLYKDENAYLFTVKEENGMYQSSTPVKVSDVEKYKDDELTEKEDNDGDDGKELAVKVKMKKANGSGEDSMADNAIEHRAEIKNLSKEKTEVYMIFKPMSVQSLKGHLLRMNVKGAETKVVRKDSEGRPIEVSFVVQGRPDRVEAEIEVDVMNSLAGGKPSPQDVYICFDWSNTSDKLSTSDLLSNKPTDDKDKVVDKEIKDKLDNLEKVIKNLEKQIQEALKGSATSVETMKDGQTYQMPVDMYQDGKSSLSMCDVMFSQCADVKVVGDNAEMKFYVAYPIPNFSASGKAGTLSNFEILYNGKTYNGISDIYSKPLKPAKTSNEVFGLVKGKEIPMQVITVVLPKSALKADKLDARTYVNVVMMSNADFDIKLGSVLGNGKEEPEKEKLGELKKAYQEKLLMFLTGYDRVKDKLIIQKAVNDAMLMIENADTAEKIKAVYPECRKSVEEAVEKEVKSILEKEKKAKEVESGVMNDMPVLAWANTSSSSKRISKKDFKKNYRYVDLNWNSVEGAEEYAVIYTVGKRNGIYKNAGYTTSTSKVFKKKFKKNQNIYFYVKAYDNKGRMIKKSALISVRAGRTNTAELPEFRRSGKNIIVYGDYKEIRLTTDNPSVLNLKEVDKGNIEIIKQGRGLAHIYAINSHGKYVEKTVIVL